MAKKIYMINGLKQTATVTVLGRVQTLEFKDLADGCVGVSLWFDDFDKAVEYNNNDRGNISEGTILDAKDTL